MDYEKIKTQLHPVFVMQQAGHAPVEITLGKYLYHSPLREDKNPSFDVYFNERQGVWKFGDWASGDGGDVIDLVTALYPNAIAEVMCLDLIERQKGWVPPETPEVEEKELDVSEWITASVDLEGVFKAHWTANTPSLGAADDTPLWLDHGTGPLHDYRVRTYDDKLLFPYFTPDDKLVGIKERNLDGRKYNTDGSTPIPFGVWRLNDAERIILCEGESDTLSAHVSLEGWHAVGIPGVSQPAGAMVGWLPDGVDEVAVAFDGDDAGNEGTRRYVRELQSRGFRTSVIDVPPGKDLSNLSVAEVQALVDRRRFPSALPDQRVMVTSNGYFLDRDTPKQISTWTLEVHTVLQSDAGGTAFEGTLLPSLKKVVLPGEVLSTKQKAVNWSMQNGVAWLGAGDDHAKLFAHLMYDTFLTPHRRMTDKVGLHEADWVWPDASVGVHSWSYVPPVADIGVSKLMAEPEIIGAAALRTNILHMMHMYGPDVTTPILAWLTASFFRPLFEQFPILFISGVSGTGKSTLTEAMLKGMTGSTISMALTGSTPHGLYSYLNSSTSFPIWFDEYRPGMSRETKLLFDQIMRDSYRGVASVKGGQNRNNLSEITQFNTAVPLIVSGEESLTETSLTQRSVMIRLRKANMGVMTNVSSLGYTLAKILSDEAGSILRGGLVDVHPAPLEGLSDREAWNLAVLDWGWNVLCEMILKDPSFIPLLDLTNVYEQALADEGSPIEDALTWAIEQGLTCIAQDQENPEIWYLKTDEFFREVKRADIFTLPGANTKTIKEFIKDKFNGTEQRPRGVFGEGQAKCMVFEYVID